MRPDRSEIVPQGRPDRSKWSLWGRASIAGMAPLKTSLNRSDIVSPSRPKAYRQDAKRSDPAAGRRAAGVPLLLGNCDGIDSSRIFSRNGPPPVQGPHHARFLIAGDRAPPGLSSQLNPPRSIPPGEDRVALRGLKPGPESGSHLPWTAGLPASAVRGARAQASP